MKIIADRAADFSLLAGVGGFLKLPAAQAYGIVATGFIASCAGMLLGWT